MRRHVKRIPDDNDIEVEYVDLDQVLSNYLDEYIAKKQKNQKTLTKHFVKFFQEQEGIFNTDEIKSVCTQVVPKENNLSPFVSYPDEISFLRTFLFALTTQNNSFDISNKNFLKGVGRFGIDSPYPSVAKKLYLYGNEINIKEIIRDKVNTLEEAQQLILAHQTNVVGSNTIQRQSPAKNVALGIQNMKMLDSRSKNRPTKQITKMTPKQRKQSTVKFSVLNAINDPKPKDPNTSGGGSIMSGKREGTPTKNVNFDFLICELFEYQFNI